MPSISERVDRGANLLNIHFGGVDRWVRKVDLSTLNMFSGSRCILGQLFGDYDTGKHRLGITYKPGDDYGFIPAGDFEEGALREAWSSYITLSRERLNGPAKVGDKVRVTFDNVTVTNAGNMMFAGNVAAPSGNLKVEVLERAKPKPKPAAGDRVKNTYTGSKGTVVRVMTNPGSVYVQWDGDKLARRVAVKYLDVIPVDYYTPPSLVDMLNYAYAKPTTVRMPLY